MKKLHMIRTRVSKEDSRYRVDVFGVDQEILEFPNYLPVSYKLSSGGADRGGKRHRRAGSVERHGA